MAQTAGSSRRGGDDAPVRRALLDAAERIMIDEGYAAVTSRRVSSAAGVNNGLVHYYFGTMDEMLVELFRRAAQRATGAVLDLARSEQPLWELWEAIRDFSDNALMTEFIALANHRDSIRAEIKEYSEQVREAQIGELTRILAGHDLGGESPAAVALLLVGMSRFVQMESAFGIDVGHRELLDAIEGRIRAVEGDRRTD